MSKMISAGGELLKFAVDIRDSKRETYTTHYIYQSRRYILLWCNFCIPVFGTVGRGVNPWGRAIKEVNMSTVFTKIVNREIPAHIVAEDAEFLAFLDIRPIVRGHTLVIPKKEIDYLWDLDDDLMSRMMVFAKKVAKALKLSVDCKKVGLGASGFDIPHAHIHLLPINTTNEMAVNNPPLKFSEEETREIASFIRKTYCVLFEYVAELT